MTVCMQDMQERAHESPICGNEGSRIGQKEKLNCEAIVTKASPGDSGTRIAIELSEVRLRGPGFCISALPAIRYGLPVGGGIT